MAIPANKTESTKDDDSSDSSESPQMAIMFMDLNVTENSNLEVFFTCLGPVHTHFHFQIEKQIFGAFFPVLMEADDLYNFPKNQFILFASLFFY